MSQDKASSRSHDLLGVILGLFCLFMLVVIPWQIDLDVSAPFYKGPFIMPVVALTIGVVASIPSCLRLLFHGKGRSWTLDGAGAPKKPMMMLLVAMLYPVLMMLIGLEPATLLVLGAELFITGLRSPKLLVFVPVLVTAIFWAVFRRLLDIYFPTPLIYYLFQ